MQRCVSEVERAARWMRERVERGKKGFLSEDWRREPANTMRTHPMNRKKGKY